MTNPTEAVERARKAIVNPYTGGIWEGKNFNEEPFATIRVSDLEVILAATQLPDSDVNAGAGEAERLRLELLQTQTMLEGIDHLKSTDFSAIRARIVQIRAALSTPPHPQPASAKSKDK